MVALNVCSVLLAWLVSMRAMCFLQQAFMIGVNACNVLLVASFHSRFECKQCASCIELSLKS